MCDALDTYFVFLRTRVLAGLLTLEREQDLVQSAKTWIESAAAAGNEAMTKYLEHFKSWKPVGDDDSPFVS
jgi:hypothetical protein